MIAFLGFLVLILNVSAKPDGNIRYQLETGLKSQRATKNNRVDISIKYFDSKDLYTLVVTRSENYKAKKDEATYLKQTQKETKLLLAQLQAKGLVTKSSSEPDKALLLMKTLKIPAKNDVFVTRTLYKPLEPHLVYFNRAIVEKERTDADLIDSFSISLIVGLAVPDCKVAAYPHAKGDKSYVYGLWCSGTTSHPKHVAANEQGLLIPTTSLLLPKKLDPTKITVWTPQEALKVAFGAKIEPQPLVKSQTPLEPAPQPQSEPEKQSSSATPSASPPTDNMIVLAFLGAIFGLIGMAWFGARAKRKKRLAQLQKEEEERKRSQF